MRMSVIDRRLDLPLISAREWNALLDRIERRLNVEVSATPPERGYIHPWKTRGRWNEEKKRWQLRISRGHANAAEVEAPRLAREDLPAATQVRVPQGARVAPWLSERPWFPIAPDLYRAIGSDATPIEAPEPIPVYFAERGVGEGPTLRVDAIDGVKVLEATVVDPKRLRRLRAVDLVLSVPKPVVSPIVETDPDGITRIRSVLQPARGVPSVRVMRRFVPASDSASLEAQLVGGESDAPTFERLVATIYLLSPPGAPSGSVPDGRWTCHVDHALYWDYFWAYRAEIYDFPDQSISLNTGLAGGAGQDIINNLIADLNQSYADAAAALRRATVEIVDWTL